MIVSCLTHSCRMQPEQLSTMRPGLYSSLSGSLQNSSLCTQSTYMTYSWCLYLPGSVMSSHFIQKHNFLSPSFSVTPVPSA